jgi:fatty acid amide hydrolase 2
MQAEYRSADTRMLDAPAVEIAARVHAGEWSARDVVDAHIARIRAVNPLINAVVAERFEAARREARAADEASASARAGHTLLGVPFTVKEMIQLEGMPVTFGCANRQGRRADSDATVVARLRAAGAIPLGVTNVPEWGMWPETYNVVYGRTCNPWDVRRTPGGSSGGEGAIVASGGSAFGIGSDIGGSVRMPAAFCGVYGHKPTHGLLPLTGHHPVYDSREDLPPARSAPYVTIGLLARSARDLMPLLRVMAGPDGIDPNSEQIRLGDSGAVDWRGRRVVLLPAPRIRLARRAAGELVGAVRRVGDLLRARGAHVEDAPAEIFRHAADAWSAALQSAAARTFADVLGDGARVRLIREVVSTALGRGRYSWPALFVCIGERIGRKDEAALARALAELQRIDAQFTQLVGDDGVLVAPAHPRPAPRHNEPVLFPFDFLYTAVLNALRVPATAVPVGTSARGLPLAVQITARRGNDHLTIAAAQVVEETVGRGRPALPPQLLADV